jgi:hypothetical protein
VEAGESEAEELNGLSKLALSRRAALTLIAPLSRHEERTW